MKRFKHVLITRFNYPEDKKELFDERMDFFKKYTLPNIQKQICKDFTWVFFSDRELEIDFKDKKFVTLTSYKEWKKELEEEYNYIIETRLDNDDVVSPEFIESIQSVFLEIDKKEYMDKLGSLVIEPKGYRYDLRNNTFYEDIFYNTQRTSPFISLISKLGSNQYVFNKVHGLMWSAHPTFFLDSRLWVQMIHNSNKLMNKDTEELISKRGIKCKEPDWFNKLE